MPPAGRILARTEAPVRLPSEAETLAGLREERQGHFDVMVGALRYRERLFSGRPSLSPVARYQVEGQPHHEKTEAWLERPSGDYNVGLYTQTIRNVGKKWINVDAPKLLARTTDEGDVAYGEEDPEFYENLYSLRKQGEASTNLGDTLKAVRLAKNKYRRSLIKRFLGRKATGIDVTVSSS